MRGYSKRARIAKLRFTLKFVYNIPGEVLDKIDIEAYADPNINFKENLERLIEAYPVINTYIRKKYRNIERAEAKAEKEWEDFLDTLKYIYEGVIEGIEDSIRRMKELGFEDVKEFEEYLKGLGIDVSKIKGEVEEEERLEKELPELPDELFGYLNVLRLEPYGEIKVTTEGPPYYYRVRTVYIIPVYDKFNDAVIHIVYPSPNRPGNKYTSYTMLNPKGVPVTVSALKKDVEKLEPWKPSVAKSAVITVEKELHKKPIKKTEVVEIPTEKIEWRKLRTLLKILSKSVKSAEDSYKIKSIIAIWYTFNAIRDTLDEFKGIIKPKLPPTVIKPKPVTIPYELKEYWNYFAKLCKNYDINPDMYKERFLEYIPVEGPPNYIKRAVEDLVEEIVEEEEYRKSLMLPIVNIVEEVEKRIKKRKPRLKEIDWAIGAMKVKLFYLDMAIRNKDIVKANMIVDQLNELTDKTIEMLKLFPQIKKLIGRK